MSPPVSGRLISLRAEAGMDAKCTYEKIRSSCLRQAGSGDAPPMPKTKLKNQG